MRFCSTCEQGGQRIGRDCMCRRKLTDVELKSRDIQRFRNSFHHDSVVVEEPDFDALSSLGLSRQIIERLRSRPLSRLLNRFNAQRAGPCLATTVRTGARIMAKRQAVSKYAAKRARPKNLHNKEPIMSLTGCDANKLSSNLLKLLVAEEGLEPPTRGL